ncbi:hypothetical protein O7623_07815 [Solwaraspora sp. WMMD791]|nr:hypothetical protein [Solwaraspora sp. WMMD791]WFE29079.1 hypothetical protein O7623_07815 [Solwaraspora sp. WMMD791]
MSTLEVNTAFTIPAARFGRTRFGHLLVIGGDPGGRASRLTIGQVAGRA